MTSRSSKVLTTNVDDPTGIAWYYNETDGTSRFYVGEHMAKPVKIFDEFWRVVGTIPELLYTSSIILSPVNTLLVADRSKKAIDEFDLDGNFLRTMLSGLLSVLSMSYHPAHPSFVWVGFYDYAAGATGGTNVKRIKIY